MVHLSSRLSLPNRLKGSSTSLNKDAKDSGEPLSLSRSTSPKLALGDNRQANLVLRTTVLKGRDLAAKDRGGTSDPYIVLSLADAREATSSVPKTLNPEWNQTFDLPIVGIESLLLEVVCWDKDKFSSDYMGEFDVALEDLFQNGSVTSEPRWFALETRKKGKKKSIVSGEVLLQFSIIDPIHTSATPDQLWQKFLGVAATATTPGLEDEELERLESGDLESETEEEDASDEIDDTKKAEKKEKKRKKLRLAKLKKKVKERAYEFNGNSDVAGVLFLEIQKITDLPPEKNMTRTGFDMDPFVVISLGKKTYRTKAIRHNLNPVYDEKLVFQVMKHETHYSLNFAVIDKDKLSNHDFVGTGDFPLQKCVSVAPEADPYNGLYKLPEPRLESNEQQQPAQQEAKRSRFRMPLSRSASSTSLSKSKPSLKKESSNASLSQQYVPPPAPEPPLSPTSIYSQGPPTSAPINVPRSDGSSQPVPAISVEGSSGEDDGFKDFEIALDLKNERWEEKHNPVLYIKAKYMPYRALRQQFWRAMLKQYDADDSGFIDKIELVTMLDTLGSTLHDETIDSFFDRFADQNNGEGYLTFDQAVICLEKQIEQTQWRQGSSLSMRGMPGSFPGSYTPNMGRTPSSSSPSLASASGTPINSQSQTSVIPALEQDYLGEGGEEGDYLGRDDLADERDEEHVVEIRECPICHQPRLNKKSDADIITHVATCASQDWRQVNNIVMAGFVTSSQAQRKWYSKVITKVGYGGYKLGANSANILVQDRITGQINEERMSVYVRLGIRLLYKGLKRGEMESKKARKLLKSLSIKQGKKYDDPASAVEIAGFINFHQLDMSEVLLPIEQFKNFNEFFYRALKPGARPCSAPEDPRIITSPADCRSVVFNNISHAQEVWVKGRAFTIERLLGKAYPEDVKRFEGGALGIFRLAPQDYHRFHIPVDGVMGEPKTIEGEYYTVNPMAIRSALDVYGENVRVLCPIDSVAHGRVMVVCVGAMMVGSTVITREAGEQVTRAEELGYFKFGGSTILLLFEPGVMRFDDDLVDNSNTALETLVRVGMSIGHSPNRPPHTPDMRKENPSNEEKQDAKRRIEGSLAPETGAGPMTANMQ